MAVDTIKTRLSNTLGKPAYLIKIEGVGDILAGYEAVHGRLMQMEKAFEASDKGSVAVLELLTSARTVSYEISEIVISALTDDGEKHGPRIIH